MGKYLPACRERLDKGIEALRLDLPEKAPSRLMDFLQLLIRWNRAYNLSAVRDPLEMVGRHLLDSLAILPYLNGPRVLDVGSGAGLPGIPLAIARPDLHFTLLDGNGKKVRFIRQVVMELGLSNVEPMQQRIEQLQPSVRFDQVTARAFSDLQSLWDMVVPVLAEEGELLAMKGTFDTIATEIKSMAEQPLNIIPLSVPTLDEQQRHLVIFRNTTR